MKPGVDRVLQQLSVSLLGDVAPAVGVDYVQRNTALIAMLLGCVAEEWDRAAARRVDENRALRRLFGRAAPTVGDESLQEKLREASKGRDTSLRIADLEAANDALRGLLIELHAHVETLSGPAASRVEASIWKELRMSTERRALGFSPF